jgi:hypothetical protein
MTCASSDDHSEHWRDLRNGAASPAPPAEVFAKKADHEAKLVKRQMYGRESSISCRPG